MAENKDRGDASGDGRSRRETEIDPTMDLPEARIREVSDSDLRDRESLAGDTDGSSRAETMDYVRSDAKPDGSSANDERILGKSLGDYELIEEVARGGMGVVYKARQTKLNRTVALKMILAGDLAGSDEIRRFETEAEAAANLQHSGIVPIYEVGEDNGRHFFSMEFVDGSTLGDLVKEGPLSSRHAASLVARIADGIAYAHSNGVVHRDLKPGNVLIDGAGEPRITDFGLAKRTDVDSSLTGTGQVLGTPSYMAPEQASANADEVGPLADVYSMGAILYCLLTGRPPFQADNVLDTVLAVIHQEPVAPRQLNPTINRDLETICLKCLEKSPARRYASARQFADDLERWLTDRPIIARPRTLIHRASLFAKRNRALVGGAAVILMTLISATAVSTTLYYQARMSQKATEAELAASEKLADFLTRDLLAAADPTIAQGRQVSINEVLTNAEATLVGSFTDRPLVEGRIRNALAQTYLSLAENDKAKKHAELALEMLTEELGPAAPQTLVAETTLARAYAKHSEHYDEAERMFTELIVRSSRVQGEQACDTLRLRYELASLIADRRDWAAVQSECRTILKAQQEKLGATDPDTLDTLLLLVEALRRLESADAAQRAEARKLLVEGHSLATKTLGEAHPTSLVFAYELAVQHYLDNRYEQALEKLAKTVQLSEVTLGEDHPRVLRMINMQATMLDSIALHEDAAAEYAKLLERSRRHYGRDENPWLAPALNDLAKTYSDRRMFSKAIELYREAFDEEERQDRESSLVALRARRGMAFNLAMMHRVDEAIEILEELLEAKEAFQADPVGYAFLQGDLGSALRDRYLLGKGRREDLDRALKLQREGLRVAIRELGEFATNVIILRQQRLGPTLQVMGRYQEAEEQYRLSLAASLKRDSRIGNAHYTTAQCVRDLAQVMATQGRREEARREVERVRKILEAETPEPRDNATPMRILTDTLRELELEPKDESSPGLIADQQLLTIPFTATRAKDEQSKWAAQNEKVDPLTTSIGLRLRLIPPGQYQFVRAATGNTPESEPMRIRFPTGFFVGESEVTVGQFRQFVEATGHVTDAERDGGSRGFDAVERKAVILPDVTWRAPGYAQQDDHPVVCVSWDDANAFCRWLTKEEGRRFDLPTEAQWEWAGRAGTKADWFFPEDLSDNADFVVCKDNGHRTTAKVTSKRPNAWGLYGVLGNVHEWTADDSESYDSPALTDPFGELSHSKRVRRGGDYTRTIDMCKVTTRVFWNRSHSTPRLGFRVVAPIRSDEANAEQDAALLAAQEAQQSFSEQRGIRVDHENSLGMRFKLIPSGSVLIGSSEGERGRNDDETSFRAVISRPFYLGETEITVGQFRQFAEAVKFSSTSAHAGGAALRNGKQTQGLGWHDPGYPQTESHPVVMVRRHDAEAFCSWLSRQEGKRYRLPTEAEWEHACRATTTTARYFAGNELIEEHAFQSFAANKFPQAVRQLKPNPWGLYDMYGNVSEWCSDWYGEYPHGKASDPQGPSAGDKAVHRGGSWNDNATRFRSAARQYMHPAAHVDSIGFRVLLEIDEPE